MAPIKFGRKSCESWRILPAICGKIRCSARIPGATARRAPIAVLPVAYHYWRAQGEGVVWDDFNDRARECLAWFYSGQPTGFPTCAEDVIKRLLRLALIEESPDTWLPLELMRSSYRVTPAGKVVREAD